MFLLLPPQPGHLSGEGRSVLTASPALPEPAHIPPGRDLPPGTTEPQGCAGTSHTRSISPPPSALAPKLSDGQSPQGLWKDLLQMPSPPQSRLLQLCRLPVETQLPLLPSWDYPAPPAGGSTESLGAVGNAWFLQPRPGTLSPYGHIQFLPDSLARETRAAAGCIAHVGRNCVSTEEP